MLKYENNLDAYTSTMQGLSSIITFILFLIYIIFMKQLNILFNLPTVLILLLFTQCLFNPAFNFWVARQRFEYKYKALIVITLCISILTPIFGIIFIKLRQYKGEAIVIGTVFAQLLFFIFFYIYNFIKGKQFFNGTYWNFALQFNIPLIPHYLAGIILGQADRIMIDRIVGRREAGIYSLVYSLSQAMHIATNGVNASLVPWTYQKIKAQQYINIRKTTNILVVFLACTILAFIAIAPEIVHIIATPDYYDAIWIIPPVVTSVYFTFLYTLFANVEFYFEKTSFIMIASVIAAGINIVLNFIFIPQYGYFAAGYTTLVCYIVFAITHYLFMKKVCREANITKIYDIRFIFIVSLGLIILSFVFMLLYKALIIRYGIIGIGLCILIVKQKYLKNVFSQ
jgi:O-antigen/teichoic acid export membrane protein